MKQLKTIEMAQFVVSRHTYWRASAGPDVGALVYNPADAPPMLVPYPDMTRCENKRERAYEQVLWEDASLRAEAAFLARMYMTTKGMAGDLDGWTRITSPHPRFLFTITKEST